MKKWLFTAILLVLNTSVFAQNAPIPRFPFPGPALGNADGTLLNRLVDRLNSVDLGAASPTNTSISTVGAGTLTAASLVGGVITRIGSTVAFTDTTATGAQLDTALPNNNPTSWFVEIKNGTIATETLAGGTGVTLSGRTLVPANSVGLFLITKSTTATYTMVGIGNYQQAFNNNIGFYTAVDNGTTQTLTSGMVSGGNITYHVSAGGTTPSLTLPLATAIDTALPAMQAGQSYILRIINTNSGTATIVTNTGWITNGTLTLATSTWRDFVIVKSDTASYTITSVGTGTNS